MVSLQPVFSDISESTVNIVCLILILIFGIPHGAVDHKIHLSTNKSSNLRVFITKYLLVAIGYTLLWLFSPRVALILFLITSAYHFGQETLENQKIRMGFWLSILMGTFIVFGPLLFHYSESKSFLDIITPGFFPELSANVSMLTAVVITAISLGCVTFMVITKRLNKSQFRNLMKFFGILITINLLFNFLVAFTIYFILFHSLNAFKHQYSWLANNKKGYTFQSFMKDLLGFSLLAIFGLVFLLWVIGVENTSQLVSYFFILTSIITLPHAITLDQFYKVIKKQNKRLVETI